MYNTGVAFGGLDITFDYIVSLMAPKNVKLVSGQPYADFDAMVVDYERTGYLKISVDHSDATIFGSASVNWQFRAWHDLCHIQANADFSPAGEEIAANRQMAQLGELLAKDSIALADYLRWSAIIDAEVNGQTEFFVKFGAFPEDQRTFALNYLRVNFGLTLLDFPTSLANTVVKY